MKTKYIYNTIGVCCKEMIVVLDEDNYMIDIYFKGGCPGNLSALKKIMLNKPYTEFLGVFEGNECGTKPVSCMSLFDSFLKFIDDDVKGITPYPFLKETLD